MYSSSSNACQNSPQNHLLKRLSQTTANNQQLVLEMVDTAQEQKLPDCTANDEETIRHKNCTFPPIDITELPILANKSILNHLAGH